VVDDRYVDTEVTAQDGQTIVLGGLIQNSETLTVTRIPVLSDIPILGQFFRGRDKSTSKDELIVFMTPHVINSPQEARELMLKVGAPVIKQIPRVVEENPNLKLPDDPTATKAVKKGVKKPAPTTNTPTTPAPTTPAGGTGSGTINPNINGGNQTP
jgi:type II secretory pathway component GspD/PulD (secretin)